MRYLTVLVLMVLCFTGFRLDAQLPGTPDSLFTEYFRSRSGWNAGDATISVPLPDGRVLWLFGDSYLDRLDTATNLLPCLFNVRNAVVVQDKDNPSKLTTLYTPGQIKTFFEVPNQNPAKHLFWPGSGYFRNDSVYVFLHYEDASSGSLTFRGTYCAVLDYPDLNLVRIDSLPMSTQYSWGQALVPDETGQFMYAYGTKREPLAFRSHLARYPIDNPWGVWEFYTGNGGWSNTDAGLAPVLSSGVSPSYSVFFRDGRYYLLTQENGLLACGLGRNIYLYDSGQPTGPFANRQLLYTIEDQYNGHYLVTYNAQAHPAYFDNGHLLVSYNVNDRVDTVAPWICASQCKNIFTDKRHADTYRPKFVRVDWCAVTPPRSSTTTASLCPGETFEWQGQMLTTAGLYLDTLTSAGGCDSLATLVLNVLDAPVTTLEVAGCPGSSFVCQGDTFAFPGVCANLFPAQNGCDSLVETHFVLLPEAASFDTLALCPGQTLDWNGQSIVAAGNYSVQLTGQNGCDSLAYLAVFAPAPIEPTLIDTVLYAGETLVFQSDTLSVAGTYPFTLQSQFGCDSLVVLTLQILVSTNEPKAGAVDIRLQPNPAAGRVLAVIRGVAELPQAVFCLDESGRRYRLPFSAAAGFEPLTLGLDASALATGTYRVLFQWPDQRVVKTLVVQ